MPVGQHGHRWGTSSAVQLFESIYDVKYIKYGDIYIQLEYHVLRARGDTAMPKIRNVGFTAKRYYRFAVGAGHESVEHNLVTAIENQLVRQKLLCPADQVYRRSGGKLRQYSPFDPTARAAARIV